MRVLSLIVTTTLLLSATLVGAMAAAAAPAAPLITASNGRLSPPRVLAVDTVSLVNSGWPSPSVGLTRCRSGSSAPHCTARAHRQNLRLRGR